MSSCLFSSARRCFGTSTRSAANASILMLSLLCYFSSSASGGGGAADAMDADGDRSTARSIQTRHLLTWAGHAASLPASPPAQKLWWGGHPVWHGALADSLPTSVPGATPQGRQFPSRDPTWQCGRMERNAKYNGKFVKTLSDMPNPAACCDACQMNLRCNVWVFCGAESGCDDQFDVGRCDLKHQPGYEFFGPDPPSAYSRGKGVLWVSGVIYQVQPLHVEQGLGTPQPPNGGEVRPTPPTTTTTPAPTPQPDPPTTQPKPPPVVPAATQPPVVTTPQPTSTTTPVPQTTAAKALCMCECPA
jgi:hypothetical protein